MGGGRADEYWAQRLDIALRVKRLMRHKALRHGKLSLSLQYDNAKSATELAWELSCIAGGRLGKIIPLRRFSAVISRKWKVFISCLFFQSLHSHAFFVYPNLARMDIR